MSSMTQIVHNIYESVLSILSEHFYTTVKETGILSRKNVAEDGEWSSMLSAGLRSMCYSCGAFFSCIF
jgi:hypothetical protein